MQGALALALLMSGNWFTGAANLAVLGYMVHLWAGNKVHLDATDVFRQLPQQKRQKLVQLACHVVLFMLVVYRLIETAVHTLLTPEGRAMTQVGKGRGVTCRAAEGRYPTTHAAPRLSRLPIHRHKPPPSRNCSRTRRSRSTATRG